MRKKFTKWILPVGCVIIGIGIIMIQISNGIYNGKIKKNAGETTAIVTSVEKQEDMDRNVEYIVNLAYIVDGKRYEYSYSTYLEAKKGSEEIIYYDKNDPSQATTSLSTAGGLVMSVICASIFLGIGILLIRREISIKKRNKELVENGKKVIAEFKEVVVKYHYSDGGKHPFVIVCSVKNEKTGKIRTFESEYLWKDPEPIIKEKKITTFPVYIGKKVDDYYVSIEEIEKL